MELRIGLLNRTTWVRVPPAPPDYREGDSFNGEDYGLLNRKRQFDSDIAFHRGGLS